MASNLDCRGIARGACSKVGCNCEGYIVGRGFKCICDHPPGVHQKLSSNSQSDFEGDDLSDRFATLDTTTTASERTARKIEQLDAAVCPPDLLCIGCGKCPKWDKGDGTYFDYCGRTCRDFYCSRDTITSVPPHLLCIGCGERKKWDRGDGTYFDYCGRSCRDAHYQQRNSLSSASAPNLSRFVPAVTSGNKCSLPNCTRRKCRDPATNELLDFCGATHASEALRQGVYVNNIKKASDKISAEVSDHFAKTWAVKKGACPSVDCIFSITNTELLEKWKSHRSHLQDQRVERHFHGTIITCKIIERSTLCSDPGCGICGISKSGFDLSRIGTNISFQRFGHAFYLAYNSSKCHDYTQGSAGYRAMLLCDVCPGRKKCCTRRNTRLTAPPQGYDSVYGKAGEELNYVEIALYNPDAILPKFIILYRKQGINKIAK